MYGTTSLLISGTVVVYAASKLIMYKIILTVLKGFIAYLLLLFLQLLNLYTVFVYCTYDLTAFRGDNKKIISVSVSVSV